VVEELAIKAIHSEGDKQAKAAGRCILDAPTRLFPNRSLINFKLLKTLPAILILAERGTLRGSATD